MKRILYFILLFLFSGLLIYSSWQYFTIRKDYEQGRDSYSQLEQYVSIVPSTTSHEVEPSTEELTTETFFTAEEELTEESEPIITVDFDRLRQINPDIVAWLYIEGTNINYPIVQGCDNEYYLNRLFDGAYNESGSIFLDANNRPDFTDKNTVVYGHYMRDGSMFHDLHNYSDPSYFMSHTMAYLVTPQDIYEIEFFSGYVSDTLSSAWDIQFTQDGFAQWLRELDSKSIYDSPIQPSDKDRILTLSTCTYEFAEARFILHGRIVE